MWKLLTRVVNAAEMRTIIAWFVASAVLQGLTLALMIPFLRALYSRSQFLTVWLIAVVVMAVSAALVETIAMHRSYRVSVFEVCDTMIDRVADHVLTLPLGWFSAEREAAVVNATSKEVNTLSHLASMVIPNLCNAFIVPLVMLGATAVVEWPLALIMAAAIVPLVLTWRLMGAATTRANEMEDRTSSAAAGRLVEFARLQPVLRATGATKTGWAPVQAALEADSASTLDGLRVKGRPGQYFNLIVNVAFALVMAMGLARVSGHRLDVVAYLAIMAVTARTLLPLTKAAMYGSEADNAKVALRAVGDILDARPLSDPEPGQEIEPRGTTIALNDVSFSYDAGRPVLAGVSLSAPQGRVTALVGPSGAGKSTILRLAARFWDVDDGTVTIGGAPVRSMRASTIMGMTSMVFQDVYLFDTTIRENLRIARPEATDAELAEAARRARLDRVIEALPHGWDTQVGPGGLSLSGGERQRVAIARAFVKDAPILLLDEITSALDGENESAITEVVRELSEGRTVIVVAHRLSTVRQADEVVFLEPTQAGARVAQRGTPQELAAVPGPFREFIEASTASSRWHISSLPAAASSAEGD
ncbi:ABC transporter ATP-binding protein [Actinomyces oris]|uniref:ABC transporter ATP-binding protein n=1 Tax=Actinomyces oris TaxID=544580 RepID=UPI0028D38DD2|nr:ABC transporter ATP-binding protein [Actinomyces oris]